MMYLIAHTQSILTHIHKYTCLASFSRVQLGCSLSPIAHTQSITRDI